MEKLKDLLEDLESYFDDKADADYSDGYIPNREMQLLAAIRQVQSGSLMGGMKEGWVAGMWVKFEDKAPEKSQRILVKGPEMVDALNFDKERFDKYGLKTSVFLRDDYDNGYSVLEFPFWLEEIPLPPSPK